MHEEAKQVLTRALSLLEREGWCQYRDRDDNGRHCITGAVVQCIPDTKNRRRVCERAMSFLYMALNRRGCHSSVATYNDDPERVFQDVRGLLLDAIAFANGKGLH